MHTSHTHRALDFLAAVFAHDKTHDREKGFRIRDDDGGRGYERPEGAYDKGRRGKGGIAGLISFYSGIVSFLSLFVSTIPRSRCLPADGREWMDMRRIARTHARDERRCVWTDSQTKERRETQPQFNLIMKVNLPYYYYPLTLVLYHNTYISYPPTARFLGSRVAIS